MNTTKSSDDEEVIPENEERDCDFEVEDEDRVLDDEDYVEEDEEERFHQIDKNILNVLQVFFTFIPHIHFLYLPLEIRRDKY